jgi:hypothetical protein
LKFVIINANPYAERAAERREVGFLINVLVKAIAERGRYESLLFFFLGHEYA